MQLIFINSFMHWAYEEIYDRKLSLILVKIHQAYETKLKHVHFVCLVCVTEMCVRVSCGFLSKLERNLKWIIHFSTYLMWVMRSVVVGMKKSSTRSNCFPTGWVWMVWWGTFPLAKVITYTEHTLLRSWQCIPLIASALCVFRLENNLWHRLFITTLKMSILLSKLEFCNCSFLK